MRDPYTDAGQPTKPYFQGPTHTPSTEYNDHQIYQWTTLALLNAYETPFGCLVGGGGAPTQGLTPWARSRENSPAKNRLFSGFVYTYVYT